MPLFLACLALAVPARAFDYPVPAAPALPAALSASARMEVAPFVDSRGRKELWKGVGRMEIVGVEAEGLSAQARTWDQDAYGSLSFLWQRQLGQALAQGGFPVAETPAPAKDAADLEAGARSRGATLIITGDIQSLHIDKRGSDSVFGTTFSGIDYFFSMQARVVVKDLVSGKTLLDKEWKDFHGFHDPTPMGRSNGVAFPPYFLSGLSQSAEDLAADPDLRGTMHLAPLPTPSQTPLPDDGKPYWMNPKTGRRMDPAWNFDPADGTPRKDFVLKVPGPLPSPSPTVVWKGKP
ncbi:MAG TPA: hypothetical protein VK914_09200 [bacterium]|nr:hypothetical protein [bacterium]